MKIQNTITQPQLEMLLRLANAMHSGNPAWRYGQSIANAISLMLPALSAEINGNSEVDPFHWPEDHGTRWTQWYATVCPDPSREENEWEEHEVCAECQSIGIAHIDCICTYMKNYPTVKLHFKRCSCCGHVDDTHSKESEEFDMKYTDEEVQQLDEATEKAIELRGDKHSITYPTHSSFKLK